MPAQGRQSYAAPLLPGESLEEYFARLGLAPALAHTPVRVTIAGVYVPRAQWARTRPKPGCLIHVLAVMHGGGGGRKNPIATLLSLAITVWNPGALLAESFGLTGIAARGAEFAFNAALGMVASALFPPPRPQIAEAQGQGATVSPTYALSGGANRARPFDPLPMIAGTHRVFADLGARPFVEFEGDEQYLYQVFNFGYNTLALGDFRIGATPLSSYAGVTTQESGSDGAITLCPGNVDTINGGDVTRQSHGWVQRTSSPGTTDIAVELTGPLYGVNDEGTVSLNEIYIEIEYRAVGSATWLDFQSGLIGTQTIVIQNGTRTPVRKTYKRSVAIGQYEVRVRKTSVDATAQGAVYEVTWSQLRSYQPDTADYTGQKRLAVKVRASGQLNGQIEQFSAVARAQCLAWTGAAWVEAETSNPAWWFRALALGRFVTLGGVARRVWGAGLAAGRVDDDSIKAWGAWCVAKGLTFNAVFDRPMSAAEMLLAVATCGRASPTWANGRLGVVYDQASLPVSAVFGMSNIAAGSFQIAYQTEQLADEVLVNFINPDLDWQRDTVRCLVPGTVTPTRTRQIDLFGCTSLDMAARAGNLYAAQNAYRARRYTWRSDFEAMPASRGDVVQLAHDLASFDYSGRLIEGSTAAALKLERSVPLSAAGAWVTLVKPDGTFGTHQVVAGSGDSDTLTLVSALGFDPGADPDHPPCDYRWLYGTGATPGRKVKIDAIRPIDEATIEIAAFDEIDAFYAAEDAGYTYTPPRPNFGGTTLSNLAVTETGVRAANGYVVQLTVTWDAQNDYAGAELWAGVNGGPEISRGVTIGRSLAFLVDDGDTVTLRLVARSSLGRLGGLTVLTATHATAFAAATPPSSVTSFTVDGERFEWGAVADVDVVGYRLKFNYGRNADWGAAAAMHSGLITASPWTPPTRPSGACTFLIVAVDAAGSESPVPATIYTDLGDAFAADARRTLETIDLAALSYPGTITGGAVSGSDIEAGSTTAFWAADAAAFWGADDAAVFWPAALYSALSYVTTVTPTRAGAGNASMTLEAVVTGLSYTIEYRRQGPGAFWDAVDTTAFWAADTATFWDAPPDFTTWPGRIAAVNEPYDLRIAIAAGATQGIVDALAVRIDVPYLSERFNDIAIAAGSGSRLALTGTFTGIDNVQVTVQADGNGAVAARIVDKDAAAGPLIVCVDSNDAAVAGVIDAVVQGYFG